MTDEALREVWIGPQPTSQETPMTVMTAVLEEYESSQEKERRVARMAVIAEALILPALLWSAAFGRTPLVRGGYALMAVGTAVMLFAAWMHRAWSRQSLPGPTDARSHLQKAGFLIARQATLLKTVALWCAPIFFGALLIGAWVYQERSRSGGYVLWGTIVAGWLMCAVSGIAKAKKLDTWRSRMEQILGDFG